PPFSSTHNLPLYPPHFPIVQLHSSFYPIQPNSNLQNSINHTPQSFPFLLKPYQPITPHMREANPFDTKRQIFHPFLQSL
ncbi:DUF72 domain-containing protein, partial [Priestia megaterium]|uniref:DUF72 domain-containing protein n=1 Tax=Priestia megaterium TaxID=1404 RepID=UPI0012B9EAD4